MNAYHEGQEVEVWSFPDGEWEKAKILYPGGDKHVGEWWYVQFPDGTRGVFDDKDILAVDHPPARGASAKYLFEECGAFRRKP